MTRDYDARGMICPLPVLKARKLLLAMQPGELLHLQTDDPVAVIDIPHFCTEAGHHLVSSTADGSVTRWTIRRG
ncbi:sulfurtransferase TusA family protein [Mesobacterium sp. TK19101]|uniref:Sulfurtransferase TusA family protein n=1 Tax=Mesobacterium hydrothermale TaxID=3111907 RepID=A0ABU6HF14_9RHOB|nr:sulfurtransferase TusA family protein [Mesobacterium sp. TK19101]MEC3861059.1 sulfurtransferase TusA family protein [Mesobacterium sp. TK19101]